MSCPCIDSDPTSVDLYQRGAFLPKRTLNYPAHRYESDIAQAASNLILTVLILPITHP
jgi:hypothetical protein